MPNRSKTPSGAKCGKKHSKYIARHQARNLLHAVAFADQIGLRLNVAVDINWLMFLALSMTAPDLHSVSKDYRNGPSGAALL
jgi:hypothetical protein